MIKYLQHNTRYIFLCMIVLTLCFSGYNTVCQSLSADSLMIPDAVKMDRAGRQLQEESQASYYWNAFHQGDDKDVFTTCLTGEYYVGFQLYYDLADQNTQTLWKGDLEISLLHGEDTLWNKPLHIGMQNQNFISTIFHDTPISCANDYHFIISRKDSLGTVPGDNVYIRVLLYKYLQNAFDPLASLDVARTIENDQPTISITYNGDLSTVLAYDIEWVFIDAYDNFSDTDPEQAFLFKEATRITTASMYYTHLTYYPTGRVWYRARAVGYNPLYRDHRIPGKWFYYNQPVAITNHQANLNWQQQTVFAEDGKYKKVMSYYDGSLRQRQSQTNLSTEQLTLVGETLYDFEGRKSVNILAVPATSSDLLYKSNFNVFDAASDPSIGTNTSSIQSKFHYDNRRLDNTIMATSSGTSQYYSPANPQYGIHQEFVPDAEGYVYSQTEYVNDGTGKVSRQSGVGEVFRMDGDHATRYYYAGATAKELIRLFGTNVGNASHYKKNLVVDPNGQVSVSYMDQEGRTIATALAGDNPANVAPLESYATLTNEPLAESVIDKNKYEDGLSRTVSAFLNVIPNTAYTFHYDVAALGSQVEAFGCQTCAYDLKVTITDPDGTLVAIGTANGNQSLDGLSYLRKNIAAVDCNNPTIVNDVDFTVALAEVGDYTITKVLSPAELTFDQMKTVVLADAGVQQDVQTLRDSYVVDPANCAICTTNTAEANAEIENAIDEIADLDCQNIYQQIIESFQTDGTEHIDPTTAQIENHELYCKYVLCDQNKTSDAFEKRLSRIYSWSDAVSTSNNNPVNTDPFFNVSTLSGFSKKGDMQGKLNDVFIATIGYDSNGDGQQDGTADYRGPIDQVTDPANTTYYINQNGLHDAINGHHLLYLDLMSKRSSLGETAYQAQLDQQHWTMYRNFYLQAKRKVKFIIQAYIDCPKAMEELNDVESLPSTPQAIEAWADDHGVNADISDTAVHGPFYSLNFACDTTFSASDSTAIIGHLKNYFNGNKKNIFHFIFTSGLNANVELNAIDAILSNYGCGLNQVAVVDPMSCVKDTTIYVSKNLISPQQPQNSEVANNNMMRYKSLGLEDNHMQYQGDPLAASREKIDIKRASDRMKREMELLPEIYKEVPSSKTKSARTMMTLTVKEPTQLEYDALWTLYDATNGSNWVNRTGWSTGDRNIVQDVTGWFGVKTNSVGNVIGIDMRHNFSNYTYCNNLTGSLPTQIGNLINLQTLNLACNNIYGSIPSTLPDLVNLKALDLSQCPLNQPFPQGLITNMVGLRSLSLTNCGLYGHLQGTIGKLINLQTLYLDSNNFDGDIPDSMGYLISLSDLNLSSNKFTGTIPPSIANWINYTYVYFDMHNNKLSGSIPSGTLCMGGGATYFVDISDNDFSGNLGSAMNNQWIYNFYLAGNKFTFSDLIEVYENECQSEVSVYPFPQDSVDIERTINVAQGNLLTLSTSIDESITTYPVSYQWFKNGVPIPQTPTPSVTAHTVTIPNASLADAGDYYVNITNDWYCVSFTEFATPLNLWSKKQTVNVAIDNDFTAYTICLTQDTTNATYKQISPTINYALEVEKCLARAEEERIDLTNYAIDKLLDERIGNFYKKFQTKCLNGLVENLNYTYVPKEYHYTLYYFDQAANLVQTVPPKGVHPLSDTAVNAFLLGTHVDPEHTLITHYQYSSLNQVIKQSTPDAGTSQFWYNDKSQLKLSQNSQQLIDTLYSYTRFDEQGRIVEVGELFTEGSLSMLQDQLDSLTFPRQTQYALTDVTLTHYDFGRASMQQTFSQQNLRTRVAWVEVTNKTNADTVRTYYTYDVHGNVKSLLQQLPGMATKRTDYVYDLISGKVNNVLYQYGEPDQFIHQYRYDADNRLTDVLTSSDAFMWNREASYVYYLHGPLARVELGEYRVQALDYYYTLQGWIKGVNTPYEGNESILDVFAGKDVFAYALGYYQGDYKPIDESVIVTDNRDQLWNRLGETMNHNGLYNGNISWMVTDLAKIGEVNNNRVKGMQAMLYQYDQLHRIVQSKSLATYAASTGFAPRSGSASPYDEDYTYDPNGNILTLQRHNETSDLADDFHYQYYANSNKLREVKPLDRDKVITGGQVTTDNILYRNLTLKGNAYTTQGKFVDIKALENIIMDPDFDAREGSDVWAHIVEDNGTYQYDAIGNLIKDQDEGVRITWTPYGKVREVHTKGDSLVVDFRYDATGNRISKSVTIRKDTLHYTTSVTRYLRDAGGNVMAIYKDSTLSEQPIYGSSRLGQYKGTIRNGSLTLGERKYELSNHLGNVLSVITDNINMQWDSAWATVASTADYYPFGLEMKGRVYNDTTSYRYGFNGKEKYNEGQFGKSVYDFDNRIYDPRIGRWFSVDPMESKYPNWSPYNSFDDNPIYFKDPDGSDAIFSIVGTTITVKTVIHITGPGASEKLATKLQNDIMKKWKRGSFKGKDGKAYTLKFDVKVVYHQEITQEINKGENVAYVENDDEANTFRSNVSAGYYAHLSKFNPSMAHEFGHLLGFVDKYYDVFVSKKDTNCKEDCQYIIDAANFVGVLDEDIMGKNESKSYSTVVQSELEAIGNKILSLNQAKGVLNIRDMSLDKVEGENSLTPVPPNDLNKKQLERAAGYGGSHRPEQESNGKMGGATDKPSIH